MTDEAIAAIEYEALVLSRHLAGLPGRTRRSGGVLDNSAYTLLSILEAGGSTTIGSLSTTTGLDTSTLNRQTAALVRDGYASRVPDPEGGLARKFHITPQGQDLLREEQEASRSALESITDDWPPADRQALARLLTRFNQAIEYRSGRTWPR